MTQSFHIVVGVLLDETDNSYLLAVRSRLMAPCSLGSSPVRRSLLGGTTSEVGTTFSKLQIYPPSTCIQLFWRSWLDWGRELRVRGTSEDIIIGGMAAMDLMRGMEEGQDILVTEHKETDLQMR